MNILQWMGLTPEPEKPETQAGERGRKERAIRLRAMTDDQIIMAALKIIIESPGVWSDEQIEMELGYRAWEEKKSPPLTAGAPRPSFLTRQHRPP